MSSGVCGVGAAIRGSACVRACKRVGACVGARSMILGCALGVFV